MDQAILVIKVIQQMWFGVPGWKYPKIWLMTKYGMIEDVPRREVIEVSKAPSEVPSEVHM